jgi:hypothetical protein
LSAVHEPRVHSVDGLRRAEGLLDPRRRPVLPVVGRARVRDVEKEIFDFVAVELRD